MRKPDYNTKMLISVHGTIGAGKTTIINKLAGANVITFCEPVDDWKNELLALYTAVTPEEKEKAIIGIQDAVYYNMERIYDAIKQDPNKIYFIERSCWDSYSIFIPLNKDLYLDKNVYQAHIERAVELEEKFKLLVPKRIKVFIHTTCNDAIRRTKNRGDGFDIDVYYQSRLHALHEEAFAKHINDNDVIYIDNSEEKKGDELGKFDVCLNLIKNG